VSNAGASGKIYKQGKPYNIMPDQISAVRERIRLGKKFARELKAQLGPVLHEAFIFGSTAKNKARKDSDIDLLFVVRKPTEKQKWVWITSPTHLKKTEGELDAFRNSYLMFRLKHRYEEKYNIEFSCHLMWPDQFKTTKVPAIPLTPLSGRDQPLRELVEGKAIDCFA
jgi:predicted nucleotidyltransferase